MPVVEAPMLSDACFDFLDEFEQAAQKLAEAVHWYSSPDFGHVYGEEIDALRRACGRVRSEPHDIDARVELLRLATSVMRFYDKPPFTSESASREADMQALVRLLRGHEKVGDLDDPERLVVDLSRDDEAGEKAVSRIAVILKRLGSSKCDVTIDDRTAIVRHRLGHFQLTNGPLLLCEGRVLNAL